MRYLRNACIITEPSQAVAHQKSFVPCKAYLFVSNLPAPEPETEAAVGSGGDGGDNTAKKIRALNKKLKQVRTFPMQATSCFGIETLRRL